MVCEYCGLQASSQGTSFFCQEHEHHLCFHCGTIGARPYRIERESNEIYLETTCPIHFTNLVVTHNGFWKELVSSLINSVAFQPVYLIQSWIRARSGDTDSQFLLLLFSIKVMMLRLCYVLANRQNSAFKVQGLEYEEVDQCFEGEVNPNAYNCKDLWNVDREFQMRCRKFFVDNNFSISCSSHSQELVTRYVCPHSLLIFKYMFSNGKFSVGLDSEEDYIELEDKLCMGKCVLSNQKFLSVIKEKMLISNLVHQQFKEMNVEIIQKRFPIFVRTPEILKALHRRQWINKIIRKDWWENYIVPGTCKAWTFIKKCLPFIAATGVIWIAYRGFDKMWNWICSLLGIEAQGLISSGATPTKTRRGLKQKRSNNAYAAQSESENFDNKLNKIAKNFLCVTVNGKKFVAWGVKNTTFFVPKHLGKYIQSSKVFEIQFFSDVKRALTIITSNCDIQEFEDKDLMQITVTGTAPLFQNCTAFIPKSLDYNFTKGVMLIADFRDMTIYEEDVRILNFSNNFTALDGSNEVFSRQVVMYDLQEKGLCGSLLCVNSNNPIVAMHIAGSFR